VDFERVLTQEEMDTSCKGCTIARKKGSRCFFISADIPIYRDKVNVKDYISNCPCVECIVKVICIKECDLFVKKATELQRILWKVE
jgi:hypothetical protein